MRKFVEGFWNNESIWRISIKHYIVNFFINIFLWIWYFYSNEIIFKILGAIVGLVVLVTVQSYLKRHPKKNKEENTELMKIMMIVASIIAVIIIMSFSFWLGTMLLVLILVCVFLRCTLQDVMIGICIDISKVGTIFYVLCWMIEIWKESSAAVTILTFGSVAVTICQLLKKRFDSLADMLLFIFLVATVVYPFGELFCSLLGVSWSWWLNIACLIIFCISVWQEYQFISESKLIKSEDEESNTNDTDLRSKIEQILTEDIRNQQKKELDIKELTEKIMDTIDNVQHK